MAGAFDFILGFHNWRSGVGKIKANLNKSPTAIRMGILGAANINNLAILDPIATHPDVVLHGIAARSPAKAEAHLATYHLTGAKAYASYDALLADADIQAVYIPLPNGLHAEWALKAMRAGKHVLVEKPLAANGREAARVRETARETGRVAVEAFHWRFYPATHRVKQLVDSGDYGAVASVAARMYVPQGTIAADDIRFNYPLAGGASMDLTYIYSTTSHFASPDMLQARYTVTDTAPRRSKADPRVDESMVASYTVEYPGKPPVTCRVDGDLARPKLWGWIPRFWELAPVVEVELERARIEYKNFAAPYLTHKIIIHHKDAAGQLTGKKQTEQLYRGGPVWGHRAEPWWTTYRCQLEAFIDKVQRVESGKPEKDSEVPWVSLDESLKLMELIDSVYEKAGMPVRGE